MIHFQDIRLGFSDKTLFAGLSWFIPEGSRTGLVGDNGSGKTTLLRMILGEMHPDSGVIDVPKKAIIGYLPQDLQELDPLPLGKYLKQKTGFQELEDAIAHLENLIASLPHDHPDYPSTLKKYEAASDMFRLREGFAFDALAGRILKGLGFSTADYDKNCRDFSGGWKMRISLAVILLRRPDIMLLDEPTNHLDTESMEWLESYLKDYRGTLVAVSHDHMFLDKMTRQTVEVFRGAIAVYKGNYSYYLREKEVRIEQLRKERELQRAEIKRVNVFIERFRYKASKASQVQSRIKQLEKFAIIPEEQKSRRVAIRFPESPRSAKEVAVAADVVKTYDRKVVLDGLSFTIYRGEKVALVGVNGAGKSTLSRLLAGIEAPTTGSVRLGDQVLLDFFSQESAQNLDYDHTVFEEIRSAGGKATDQERRNLLGSFLFSGDAIQKKIAVLSGGEKSRLALLKLLLQHSNCLILDEPTNHLDIKTKNIFQQALLGYSGTVIIVSHDRHFLDELVTRVFEIRDRHIFEYPGNYSYFIEKRNSSLASPAPLIEEGAAGGGSEPPATESTADVSPAKPGPKSKEQKKQEALRRNQLGVQKREVLTKIRKNEQEVARLEQLKKNLEASLCDPQFVKDGLKVKTATQDLTLCARDLESRLREWELLMEEHQCIQKDLS